MSYQRGMCLVPPPMNNAADLHRPQGRSSSLRCGRSTLRPATVHRLQHGRERSHATTSNNPDPHSLRGSPLQIRIEVQWQQRVRGEIVSR